MLSPETTKALEDALDAVIEECGDAPEYEELTKHLAAAKSALPEGGAKDDEPAEDEPSEDEDEPKDEAEDKPSPPDNFAEAQRRFIEKRKAAPKGDEE